MQQGDFPEKQDTATFFFFFVLGEHCLYKIDLNRHFTATNLPPQVPDFSLYRCSSSSSTRRRRRRPLSSPSVYHLTVGRCNRFLSISKRKSLPPLLPEPYLKLYRATQLPEDSAMVALGSQIFIIGGRYAAGCISIPSKDVFVIDIHNLDSDCRPRIVRKAAQMNSEKREPIACAIGGKIYVMPDSFTAFTGDPDHFECFDPHSNSWTILPVPPSTFTNLPKLDGFEILIDRSGDMLEPLSVSSHAVLGSNLIISLGRPCTAVYAFDTAQPHRGWRRVFLSVTPSLLLNFIPFRPQLSFPIGDHTIYSRHRHNPESQSLDKFLQDRFNIGHGDSFVCSFGDLGSEFVEISIAPLSGVNAHEKFVETSTETKVARIGDGLFLLAQSGYTKAKGRDGEGEGVGLVHHSFDIFRVQQEDGDCNYVASNISSALFRAKSDFEPTDISYTFVCNNGIFSN